MGRPYERFRYQQSRVGLALRNKEKGVKSVALLP